MNKTLRTVAMATLLVAGAMTGPVFAQATAPAAVPTVEALTSAAELACTPDPTAAACIEAIVQLLARYPEAAGVADRLVGADVVAGLAGQIEAQRTLNASNTGAIGGTPPAQQNQLEAAPSPTSSTSTPDEIPAPSPASPS